MTKPFFCFIVISIFLIYSCAGEDQNHLSSSGMYMLAEQEPDSLYMLLSQIDKPEELGEEEYYNYILLKTQVSDKTYRDLPTELEIEDAKAYFVRTSDYRKIALCTFYNSRSKLYQGLDAEAMRELLEAEQICRKLEYPSLMGLIQCDIASLLEKEYLSDEAIARLTEGRDCFVRSQNIPQEVNACILIGNSYLLSERTDSALLYYDEALQIAREHHLAEQIIYITSNISVVYQEMGDYESAIQILEEALCDTVNIEGKALIYYNLSLANLYSGNIPKAKEYFAITKEILSTDNINRSASFYYALSELEENQGNYKKALKYYKIHSTEIDSIYGILKDKKLYEIQEKYNYEMTKAENRLLELQKTKMLLYFSFFLFLIMLVALYFYRKWMINSKIALEAQNTIYKLKELAKTNDENKNEFREILVRQFNIMKKVNELESCVQQDNKNAQNMIKKVNGIIYGQDSLDWDMLYETINRLYDGFFDKLKSKYPQLDETEFKICCLSYTKFTSAEISLILKISSNTVNMKRSQIRKKIGIESFGNINQFFDKNLPTLNTAEKQ